MIRHCLVITVLVLLVLPQMLLAEGSYKLSFLLSAATKSGNIVIWETMWPDALRSNNHVPVGLKAELYLVRRNRLFRLIEREGERIVPNTNPLIIMAEESSPDRLGFMLFKGSGSGPRFWFEVLHRGQNEPESIYRIELPGRCFPACASYLPSLNAWAFVIRPEKDSSDMSGSFEGRLLRIVRPDGKVLAEARYSVPKDASLQSALLDSPESHIGLLYREFRSEEKGGPRIYAVTFNLTDLSKGPRNGYLTDEKPLDADTLAFSCDRRYFSAFQKSPEGERRLVSIWGLSGGRIARISGPSPLPDLPGESDGIRMGWSVPGDRLVFANCDRGTLCLALTDHRLKVLRRRSVSNCGDLSPCGKPGLWYYFDREDCLIYDIEPPRQWRIVRYDFASKKARVIKTAKYGLKHLLKHRDEMLKLPSKLPQAPAGDQGAESGR